MLAFFQELYTYISWNLESKINQTLRWTWGIFLDRFSKCYSTPLLEGVISAAYIEPRQYKNDSIQSKIIPRLKLPLFCPDRKGGEKARQFQSLELFLTEWSRSYIVLALVTEIEFKLIGPVW